MAEQLDDSGHDGDRDNTRCRAERGVRAPDGRRQAVRPRPFQPSAHAAIMPLRLGTPCSAHRPASRRHPY